MKALLHVVGMGLGGAACFLILIAMATTGWLKYGASNFEMGLFMVCNPTCNSFSPTGAQAACRFFVIAGFFLSLGGVIDAILYYVRFVMKDIENRLLPLIAGICFIIAGVTCFLAAIVWAAKVKDDMEKGLGVKFDLGFSYALDILGFLLAMAAGALIMVQRSRPIVN